MESLADFLRLPADSGTPTASPDPEPAKKLTKLSARDFARGILASPEYRQSIKDRIKIGELPPAVEVLLYHYAYGKPVDHVEVKNVTTDIDEMSVEECEREAERLLAIARELRDDDSAHASVH